MCNNLFVHLNIGSGCRCCRRRCPCTRRRILLWYHAFQIDIHLLAFNDSEIPSWSNARFMLPRWSNNTDGCVMYSQLFVLLERLPKSMQAVLY
jgi:hypothetical protein